MLALLITTAMADVVGLGQRCGGFISNSNTCSPPLVCVLSKIPDAGGLCQLPTATNIPGVSNLPGIPTNIPTSIPTNIPTNPSPAPQSNVPPVTQGPSTTAAGNSTQATTTAATTSTNSAETFGVYLWALVALFV
ncbi:hypothetical protein HDV04_002894 [Boothiomyces sp. JEL0838]|nr:hypothetical protein HDV04_002894 [Boothiomyces sp. JEL0838]